MGEKLVITILTLIGVAITLMVTKQYTDTSGSNQDKELVWYWYFLQLFKTKLCIWFRSVGHNFLWVERE